MRFAFYTLGCKVNQYETQAMEKLLRERGHTLAEFDGEADAYVVNTCSVTAAGDGKSRRVIRRIRREHPGAVVAVCGCYAQTQPEAVRELGVDLLSGTGGRAAFVDALEPLTARRLAETRDAAPVELLDSAMTRRTFEPLPAGGLAGRTRAMLKIEDGCQNFCAYCVIPYARGPVRSAPPDTALSLARDAAASGVREIVLTGIEISSWGRDLGAGQSLIDLTETLCRALPDTRFRLGSLEPRTVTAEFCERAAALPNLCPQFHLSLQSGCDATLKRMRRRYDTARYFDAVELLRAQFPRPALTTDLITGFPGETEAEFSDTLAFLRRCAFAKVHVFPYSPRPGTPAAAMPQIEKAVKEDRARRAAAVARETRRAYLESCVGETYAVLFEQPRGGFFVGHAPNYMETAVPARDAGELRNTIRPVRVLSTDGDTLFGELDG